MPSDISSWYFLQMSKRWKIAVWGREKSLIKLFLYLRDCGVRVGVALVATKWILYIHMSLKKKLFTLTVTYWLSFSLWILEINMYHTGTYCIKMLKREEWGLVIFFKKIVNVVFWESRVGIVLRLGVSYSVF